MITERSGTPVLQIPAPDFLALEFEKTFPYGPDGLYGSGLIVRAIGPHVHLEQQVVLGCSGPSDLLRPLYADFRGWEGERSWTSLEGELHLADEFDELLG